VIVRHAKAKADSPRGDHGRELSRRGRLQAIVLRSWTEPGGPLGDVRGTVVVSDAARTIETFELGLAGTPLCRRGVVDPSLYNGIRHVSTSDVLESLRLADDGDGDLVVVAHNPTVLDVTADLARDHVHVTQVLARGFGLCAAAVLGFDGPSPTERGCELVAFVDPSDE
jgi:phosphohistidine phosphatase SixA